MKQIVLKTLNESLRETKRIERKEIINFLDYLSTVYLNTLISDSGMETILSYIRGHGQEEIMDFIYRVNSNLILNTGAISIIKLYESLIEAHKASIGTYKDNDEVYYAMIKVSNKYPVPLIGVCYLLRLNIEQLNLVAHDV